jgi:hypothetical protein
MIVPHWSASRFMLWDQCPGAFKARYVDEQPFVMTEAVAFGSAVHLGLEAHFNDQDGARAFRAAWRTMADELGGVNPNLTGVGLTLIEQVVDLKLEGVPERGFSIDTNQDLGAPIVGAVDLWDEANSVVYDFKTSIGHWSQERAQKEVWQPLLYTSAFWEETEHWPAFEYIVMNRATGQLDRFRREWTEDGWLEQMGAAYDRAMAIARDVRADRFECHGNHGYCPECGARFSHDHVCNQSSLRRVRLHA